MYIGTNVCIYQAMLQCTHYTSSKGSQRFDEYTLNLFYQNTVNFSRWGGGGRGGTMKH